MVQFKDFPARAKDRRLELKLSKAQLARVSGIAQQQIYRYEAGISTPRDDIVHKLAAALLVEPLWLINGIGPKFRGELADEPVYKTPRSQNQLVFPGGDVKLEIAVPSWLLGLLKESAKERNNDLEREIIDRLLRSYGYTLLPKGMTKDNFLELIEQIKTSQKQSQKPDDL